MIIFSIARTKKYFKNNFSVIASHAAGVAGKDTTEAIPSMAGDYFVIRISFLVMTN